jgi:hypothetical protein
MTTTQKHLRAAQVVAGSLVDYATITNDLVEGLLETYEAAPTSEPQDASPSVGDAASVLINLTKAASVFFSPADNTNRSQPS